MAAPKNPLMAEGSPPPGPAQIPFSPGKNEARFAHCWRIAAPPGGGCPIATEHCANGLGRLRARWYLISASLVRVMWGFLADPAKQPDNSLRVPFAALRRRRHLAPVKLGRDSVGAHVVMVAHNVEKEDARLPHALPPLVDYRGCADWCRRAPRHAS